MMYDFTLFMARLTGTVSRSFGTVRIKVRNRVTFKRKHKYYKYSSILCNTTLKSTLYYVALISPTQNFSQT